MSRVWVVHSAGLRLPVAGPDSLPSWWEQIAPHIPGAQRRLRDPVRAAPALTLPERASVDDVRRAIGAGLHVGHLRRNVLSVHGVALERDGRAVLLLGGHGAGKSLAGLSLMTAHRWRPVAGDVCLIRAAQGGRITVAGGTRSYVVRPREAARWFPGLALPAEGSRADIADILRPWYRPAADGEVPLAATICVRVGGESPGSWQRQPRQVAVSALYRASSYLIDKVLDDPDTDPLRTAEDAELCRTRMRLARQAASRAASWWAGGSPHVIAAEVSRTLAGDMAECR